MGSPDSVEGGMLELSNTALKSDSVEGWLFCSDLRQTLETD